MRDMPLPSLLAPSPFAARGRRPEKGLAARVNVYCRNSLIPHHFRKFATRMPCPPKVLNLKLYLHLGQRQESINPLSKSKKMVGIQKSQVRTLPDSFRLPELYNQAGRRSFLGEGNRCGKMKGARTRFHPVRPRSFLIAARIASALPASGDSRRYCSNSSAACARSPLFS